jgi:hypothetical protein
VLDNEVFRFAEGVVCDVAAEELEESSPSGQSTTATATKAAATSATTVMSNGLLAFLFPDCDGAWGAGCQAPSCHPFGCWSGDVAKMAVSFLPGAFGGRFGGGPIGP